MDVSIGVFLVVDKNIGVIIREGEGYFIDIDFVVWLIKVNIFDIGVLIKMFIWCLIK